jgi:tape measure domain-containing protein
VAGRDFEIRIIGDSSKAVRAAEQFGAKLDQVFDDGKKGSSSFSDVLKGSFLGTVFANGLSAVSDAVSSFLGEATQASDATDKFKATLNFAGVSPDQIESLTKATRAYADQTVYSLGDIQNVTAQLAANSVPNYDKLAMAAGNLNAVAGGNAETFKSVGMVLTQTAGQGKLTTENWNQLADAIPGASGKLQEALLKAGAYTGNFRDAMEKGEITAEEFNAAIMELGMQDVAQKAATSTATIEGAVGNLQAALVGGLSNVITTIKPALTGALSWSANAITGFFAWFNTALAGVVALLGKGDFTTAFRTAFHVEEDSPVVDVILRIRDTLVDFGARVPQILSTVGAALAPIGDGLVAVFRALGDSASSAAPMLSPLGIALGVIGQAAPALAAAIGSALQSIAPALPALAGSIGQVVGVASDLVSALAPLAGGVLTALAQAVAAIAPPILNTVAAVVGWIVANKDWLGGLGVAAGIIGGVVGAIYVFKAAQLAVAAATYGAQGAMVVAGLSSKIYGGIMKAQAIATGVVTAAQWAWNTAMDANPIGLVITAIVALIGALVWFFTQTDLGREIWKNVTAAIGAAVKWLWENVLQPVFTAIGAIFTWIYQNIILPIVTGIMLYIGLWAAVITWLWENVLSPVFAAIGAIFTWIYQNVIQPIVDYIVLAIRGWGIVMQWLNDNIVQPVFRALGAAFQWVWANVISPTVSFISDAIRNVGNTVRDVFGGIGSFIGSAFQAALSVVRGPINGIISLVNSAISGLNSLSVTIPSWVPVVGGQTWGLSIPSIPYLATGGLTSGPMLAMIGDNPGGRELVTPLDQAQDHLERVALAAVAHSAGNSDAPRRWAREDLDYLARRIGAVVVDGINRGSAKAVFDSLS